MVCNKFAIMAIMGVLGSSALWAAEAAKVVLPQKCVAADRESVRLDTKRFTVHMPLEICDVPMKGWSVTYPAAPEYKDIAASGITVEESSAVIGGVEVPTLVITCKKGTYKTANGTHPVIELPLKFDASEWNILSFIAKVETTPEDLEPKGFGMDWPRYGLDCSFYGKFIDGFGVAIQDPHFDWAAHTVPTTYFPYHHVRRDDQGIDGFKSFQWDMENDDVACNKKPILTQVRSLRFFYNTTKLKDKESVKITIAKIKLVKGASTKPDDAERYMAWKDWVKNYEPDYSDSSKYLLPPEEGRIAKPVQLAKDGKALAEIVVDLSDKIRIENWVPEANRQVEHKTACGLEFEMASEAANELKLWLDKITGADFEVRRTASKEKKPRIYLGATFAAPFFKADIDKLAAAEAIDGYAVRERNGDIYIFGATPAGTRSGVYAFLENNSDIIFAFYNRNDDPDETAVYSVNPNLTAVWGDAIDIPVFISRGFSRASNKFLTRLRNYYYYAPGGHILAPQYYDHSEGCRIFNPILFGEKEKYQKWSEYRSLVCLNEEGWDDYIKEWMCDRRYEQSARYAYSDGLDDNYGYCNCEKCTAPFVTDDGRMITPMDFNDFWSSWLFRHYNKMADARAAVWPGYESGGFCYFISAPKPPIKVSENYARPWICTYVRKSQCVPIFAPINQHWWQFYKDWTAHTPNCMLYDYYFLFAKIHPIAEVLKHDLMGMRDLHFLRIMSEDCGEDEYMGLADERWCVSRLYWNPDADVEQLHRYFNRRVYREAAPWIDKFRGTIRTTWYKRFKQDIEFEGRDVRNMIAEFNLDGELRGYLQEAYKAAKHPKSKLLVQRMAMSYLKYMCDPYMNDGRFNFASSIPGIPTTLETPAEQPKFVRPQWPNNEWRLEQLTSNLAVYENDYASFESDLYNINRWLAGGSRSNDLNKAFATIEGYKAFGDAASPYKTLVKIYKEINGKDKDARIAYLKETFKSAPLIVKPQITWLITENGITVKELYPNTASLAWVKDYLAEVETEPVELARRRRVATDIYARGGYIDEVQALIYETRRDLRADRSIRSRGPHAQNALATLIENNPAIDAKRAIAYIDAISPNFIDQSIGWLTDLGYSERDQYLRANLIAAFAKRGTPDEGAKVLAYYRDQDLKDKTRCDRVSHMNARIIEYWKEAEKPVQNKIRAIEGKMGGIAYSLKHARESEKAGYQAQLDVEQKNLDKAKGELAYAQEKIEEATLVWRESLKVTVKDGFTRKMRGNAKKSLLYSEWDEISQSEKIVRINELIADKWMADDYRLDAAKRIKSIYEDGDKVDWKRYSEHIFLAITLGNWSHAAEFVTRYNGNDDYRLDFVIAETKKMKEAGQKQLAIQTLRRAGEYLDYKAGNEKKKPYDFSPTQFLNRIERYNNALNELHR